MALRPKILALTCAVLLSAGLAAYVVLRLEVTTDVAELLPDVADKDLASMSQALAQSRLTRSMIISVGAAEPSVARAAARVLADALRLHPEVALVQAGPDPELGQAAWDLYFPHRLALASDSPEVELPLALTATGMREAAQAVKRELSLPTAPIVKKIALLDPYLLFLRQLKRLEGAQPGGVQVVQDQFMSANGDRALVFLATRHSALDGAYQAPLLAHFDATIATLERRFGRGLSVQSSGVNRFAVRARADIEADVTRISAVSTLALLGLFLALFRSVRLIALAQLPIAFGLLAGAAATAALFGRVHGMALAFGSTLIGVCIDYPIHFLNHHTLAPHPNGPQAGLRQLWTGLWLGAVTTIVGFAALGASSYPGLRQVAVFASVGIAGALLATAWWLPLLVAPQPRPVALHQRWAAAMGKLLTVLRTWPRLLWALVAVSLAVALGGMTAVQWSDDVEALSSLDPALQAEDAAVRAQVGGLEPGQVVVATGPTEEIALQRNDAAAVTLRAQRQAGALGDFRSAHDFMWSAALQQRNLGQWQHFSAETFREIWATEGFAMGAFAPFMASLMPHAPPLTWADVDRTPLGAATQPFRTTMAGKPALLTFLTEVRRPEALRSAVAQHQGVHFFDQTSFVNAAYANYRASSWWLIIGGIFAILAVIALQYRSLRLTLVTALPAVVAGLGTLGLLALLGERLNLLHVVGFVIVLCIGVDYGVYLAETTVQHSDERASALSVLLSALATVLGFGLLGASHNPALHAIGTTVGVGVLWSLVLAPTVLLLFGRASEASPP